MQYDERMMITSETYRDDEVDEIFSLAIEEDETERQREEGRRIAKRLVVAFILVVATGAACWVVLPRFGMVLPPVVVFLLFGVMAFASLAPLFEGRSAERPTSELDDARPITCSGVRPVGEMSRRRQNRCDGGSCG